jgi:hypothetical protein
MQKYCKKTDMTIEEIQKNTSFLFLCKDAYFKKIRPADSESRLSEEYKSLVEIGKIYFDNNLVENFGMYLKESQYRIQLWTAHLILEYGNPNNNLRQQCIDEIIKYTNNPLAREIENEEKLWLNNYYENQTKND